MNDRDLTSKLKARAGGWQRYVDHHTATQASDEDRSGALPYRVPGPPPLDTDLPVVLESHRRTPDIGDGETISAETQIAELQAALTYERDLSRKLLETVAREQVLHAVTLQSQEQRVRMNIEPGTNLTVRVPERAPAPERHMLWHLVVVFVGLGCSGLIYLLLKWVE